MLAGGVTPSSLIYQAPPVRYPVVRSVWLACALALVSALGALALAAWAWQGAGLPLAGVLAAEALWLLCSALAWHFWFVSPCGTLVWSGHDWGLETSAGDLALGALEVHLDLQSHLWLCLRREGARALWLWPQQVCAPERWGDLRRAVYSRAGRGPADARNYAPPSDHAV